MPEQLALDVPASPRPDLRPTTYFEHRGPHNCRPIRLVTRYGPGRGVTPPPFPLVRTPRALAENVTILRDDCASRHSSSVPRDTRTFA